MPHALQWGIKTSLVSYVGSQSDGTVEVSDGAQRTPDGAFRFPFLEQDTDTHPVLRYTGAVRLRAHGGMLDIAVSDPWIELSPVPAISMLAAWTGDPAERVAIAHLDVAQGAAGAWSGTRVRLTADGALTLGALQYYEGQPVDDAAFSTPV
jgi:hypothetical protein